VLKVRFIFKVHMFSRLGWYGNWLRIPRDS